MSLMASLTVVLAICATSSAVDDDALMLLVLAGSVGGRSQAPSFGLNNPVNGLTICQ